MGMRRSSSARDAARATQMRPRTSLPRKLILAGVDLAAAKTTSPSFSRSLSSTTTMSLPLRMSAMASGMVLNSMAPRFQEAFHVFAEQVDLEVEPGSGRGLVQRGMGQGMG